MATEVIYNGDGTDVTFDITFPFLRESDVKVSVGGTTKNSPADYSITGTVVTFVTAPPNATGNVRIYRNTDIDEPRSTFETGSSIRANELNRNIKQLLFAIKEVGTVTANDSGLGLVAGSKGDIHVNTATDWYIRDDSVESNMMADNSVVTSNITDLNVTTTKLENSTGTTDGVTTQKIADDAVTAAKLSHTGVTAGSYTAADITVDEQGRITAASTGEIAATELATNSVITSKILDGNVTKAKLGSDAAPFLIPTGGIIWWPKSTIPAGFVLCAGQYINNGTGQIHVKGSDWQFQGGQTADTIVADFSALYAIVGSYIPDLRGEFIRGWDAYRGVDSSNGIPSGSRTLNYATQTHQIGTHNHTFRRYANTWNGETSNQASSAWRNFNDDAVTADNVTATAYNNSGETRPRNIALAAIIKY